MKLDVALLHAPSVYDFRKKDDILFAYLANSDSVHVSGIFEMPPVGLLAIYQYLKKQGLKVEFFNLASHMLKNPQFDADTFLVELEADYVGIDLHWIAHTQGALEVARIFKESHKHSKVFLGGISASQWHRDAITYPQIDYVIRGNNTLKYVYQLVTSGNDYTVLETIPNLTWKSEDKLVFNNIVNSREPYTALVDWKEVFGDREEQGMTPYNIIIPQYGCNYNCSWCGGSQYANRKEYGIWGVVEKTPQMLKEELNSLIASGIRKHTVTMINYWHENDQLLQAVEEAFSNDKIEKIHISIRRLPQIERITGISWRRKLIIELSPDSDQDELCRLCGHAHYTMVEMETFIDALLDKIYSFEIYFMIGIPNQTRESTMQTMNYAVYLLGKYKGKRVLPYICPMLPFLDKDSIFYDQADRFGYKIFHHSLQDYANALLSMNWKNRLNYETNCLSREELVAVTYETIREFTNKKAELGLIPRGMSNAIIALIDQTVSLLKRIENYENIEDCSYKEREGKVIRKEIYEYNQRTFQNVRSQQRPIDLGFSKKQWFDTEEAFKAFREKRRKLDATDGT